MAKDKEDKEPDVTVMGEEVSSDEDRQDRRDRWERKWDKKWERHFHHHHHDDGGGVMGAIFIFVGVVLLLNVAGVLSWGIWNQIQNFWPILIILFGVGIVFGHDYFGRFVSGTISLIIILGLLLFILTTPFPHILDHMPTVVVDFVNLFKYVRR